MNEMELDDALNVLSEISEGDEERQAFEVVKASVVGLMNDCDAYRTLYEGALKKLARYRDMASRPDIPENASIGTESERKAR